MSVMVLNIYRLIHVISLKKLQKMFVHSFNSPTASTEQTCVFKHALILETQIS